MVPQTSKELRGKEQPLVLVARADGSEGKDSKTPMKVVRLTRKRGANHTLARIKGQIVEKGQRGLPKIEEQDREPKQSPNYVKTDGLTTNSILLQERDIVGREGREEGGSVKKKVFLPMVERRPLSAPVITSSRILLPSSDRIPQSEPVRKTPVLLENNLWANRASAERNIPVILTSKEMHSYDEPVNLSMKKPVERSEPAGQDSGTNKLSLLPANSLHTRLNKDVISDQPENLSKEAHEEVLLYPPPAHTRGTFSSPISMASVLTPSEGRLSHSVSITPIRKQRPLESWPNNNLIKTEPLSEEGFVVVKQEPPEGVDPLDNRAETDIDDDEETYLQKMEEADIASMVQVKLECSNDDTDAAPESAEGFSCPKCPRTYSRKQMRDLHMRKAHNMAKCKERCDICGVRFINVRAHKEKYHFFVDVDKCHLCGKVVKYLASHHCPLQSGGADKESKMDCPSCGNLVKQKYLKIHQKNHCVGIRTSTFANFRTAVNKNKLERMPLQLTQRLEAVTVKGEAETVKGGGPLKGVELRAGGSSTKTEGMVAIVGRGREVQLAQR